MSIKIKGKTYKNMESIQQDWIDGWFFDFRENQTTFEIEIEPGDKFEVYYKNNLQKLTINGISKFYLFYEYENNFQFMENEGDNLKFILKKTRKNLK